MKTIREIVEYCAEDYYPYHEYSGAYEDKNKESLDQALKEISELLVECKPKKEVVEDLKGQIDYGYMQGWNACRDDYEKNIKELLQ